jgi:hypothetical protein
MIFLNSFTINIKSLESIKNIVLCYRLFFILIFIYVVPVFGQQGNYKFNHFGNKSILLSGNVTGSVEDIALAYYNPSRLTEVEDTRFAFNARAYQFSSLKLTNILGDDSAQNNNNFDGVPSMAGGTFNLFGTRFAFSFLSRTRSNIGVNYSSDLLMNDILDFFQGTEEYRARFSFNTTIKDSWYGLTWASKVTDKLSVGISGFGSLYRYSAYSNVDFTIKAEPGNIAFYQNGISSKQKSYGLIFKIGANYKFSNLDLGININLPYLEVYQDGKFNYNKTIAGIDNDNDLFIDYNLNKLNSKRKEPFGVSVGMGIPWKKSKFHLNADYVSGLQTYKRIDVPDIDFGNGVPSEVLFGETRKNIINFGIGAEIYISEKFKSFGGFTTDFNSLESNSTIYEQVSIGNSEVNLGADFVHGSAGIDWELKWGNIILGATFTSGSSEFLSPLNVEETNNEAFDNDIIKVDYSRWQFIVGLEFPFLDNSMKRFLE